MTKRNGLIAGGAVVSALLLVWGYRVMFSDTGAAPAAYEATTAGSEEELASIAAGARQRRPVQDPAGASPDHRSSILRGIAPARLTTLEQKPEEHQQAYAHRAKMVKVLEDVADRAQLTEDERSGVWSILADGMASYDRGEGDCLNEQRRTNDEFDAGECMRQVQDVLADEAMLRITELVGEEKARLFGRSFVELTIFAGGRIDLFERRG